MVRPLSEAELTERFGTREERLKRHERAQRNMACIARSNEKWRRKYPNRFVLLFDGRVVAVAEDLEDVAQTLDQLGAPRDEVMVWYVRVSEASLVTSNIRVDD